MKYSAVVTMLLVFTSFSCTKKEDKNVPCQADLTITSAQTPSSVTRGTDIIALLKCYGPNSCYGFSHVEVKKVSDLIYDVRTKGTVQCKAEACLDVLMGAAPTINIATPLAGQYIIRYYNVNTLFKADTVIVN